MLQELRKIWYRAAGISFIFFTARIFILLITLWWVLKKMKKRLLSLLNNDFLWMKLFFYPPPFHSQVSFLLRSNIVAKFWCKFITIRFKNVALDFRLSFETRGVSVLSSLRPHKRLFFLSLGDVITSNIKKRWKRKTFFFFLTVQDNKSDSLIFPRLNS